MFAELLDQVADEVQIEPPLEPLTGERLPTGTIKAKDARLDIAARGFWQQYEMAYFDVKVFNPYAKSYINLPLESVFETGEKNKKKAYNARVIESNMARSPLGVLVMWWKWIRNRSFCVKTDRETGREKGSPRKCGGQLHQDESLVRARTLTSGMHTWVKEIEEDQDRSRRN